LSYPKFSISECTTYSASFEEDLVAYRLAGADGIGIWERKLPSGRDEWALDRLAESGLKASICVADVPAILPDAVFTDPKDPRERRDALCASIRRFARFQPVAINCVTGDPASAEPAQARQLIVDGLRAAADVAGELGITLGLEPLRQAAGTLITTIPEALDLMDEVGAPNIRIVVDVWHFWDLPGVLDDLRRHADRLIGVQVNDWPDPPRSWCDRVLPGDGIMDLKSIFGALEGGGYDGWYDLEVFSDNGVYGNAYPDSLWDQDPGQVAERGVRQFRATWDDRIRPGGA
jgi:sugar phosphate isomerase/epimerase